MDEQRLTDELARLRQGRDAMLKDAERQLAMMDGAIQVLEHLLKPENAETDGNEPS